MRTITVFCRLFLICSVLIIGLLASLHVIQPVQPAHAALPIGEKFTSPDAITGTVTIWHAYAPGTGEGTALHQVILSAETANPALTVNDIYIPFETLYSDYQTAVLAGGGPDMFMGPNDELGNHMRAGVIRNLDAELQGQLPNFIQTAIEGMQVNGELYGVPESAKALAMYYNKSLLTMPPTTTVALQAALLGGEELASTTGTYFPYWAWGAFGGQLMDTDGKCIADQGGFAPAMQYLLDLQSAGAFLTSDYGAAEAAFLNSEVDMLVNGPWALADYEAALGSNLGVAVLPAGPVDIASPINGIEGIYINPNTTHFTATLELALFMTSQASSQMFTNIGGHIPVRTDVVSADPLVNTFALASAQGFPRPQNEQFNNYWGPFDEMINNVLTGMETPAEGVQRACNRMNELNGFPIPRLYLSILVK